MFKRTILAAIAVSMLAVPMAQAQSRYDGPRQGHGYSRHQGPAVQAPANRHQLQRQAPWQHQFDRHMPPRHHAQRPAPSRHDWARGQRVPGWQQKQHVRDYHRHGLRRPAYGQQWVKVDNDYLLISLATGIILGMAAAR